MTTTASPRAPDGRENVPSYIGRCPTCQRIDAAIVDDPNDPVQQSREGQARRRKFVQECMRDGYVVERSTVGVVRASDFGCTCRKAERAKRVKKAPAPTQSEMSL